MGLSTGRLLLALPLLGSLLLAACGQTPAQPPPMPNIPLATTVATPSPAPTTSPFGPAEKSSRGLLIKKVGQPAGFTNQSGAITATFVVDKITVNGKCTNKYAQKPEHGHFVIVEMRVETTSNLSPDEYLSISPSEWSIVGPDGVTESSLGTGPAYSCLDQKDQFPGQQFTPASKYRGTLALDTANTSGNLLYRPLGGGGWEWTFPA
jgi:hypothetical protein